VLAMKAVAREFVHPNGKRRIPIYARSDGAFCIAEEALYTNDYDPKAPFSYWADTYLRSGLFGRVADAMAEIEAMPDFKDYTLSPRQSEGGD